MNLKYFGDINNIIGNITALFNKPWYLMETEYFCTMSMGVAVFPDNSVDVHEITRMADVAMYEARGQERTAILITAVRLRIRQPRDLISRII